LNVGAFRAHAAEAAGIAANTLEEWLKRGRDGDRRYAKLAIHVDQAIAEDAIRKQTFITTAP
jgi:hypothetical protein